MKSIIKRLVGGNQATGKQVSDGFNGLSNLCGQRIWYVCTVFVPYSGTNLFPYSGNSKPTKYYFQRCFLVEIFFETDQALTVFSGFIVNVT